jgi:hypothetical protein
MARLTVCMDTTANHTVGREVMDLAIRLSIPTTANTRRVMESFVDQTTMVHSMTSTGYGAYYNDEEE